MSPHFQNMKHWLSIFFPCSSKFCFYIVFFPMILYRFSSKYAKVRMAYVGAISVCIAVPRVWM